MGASLPVRPTRQLEALLPWWSLGPTEPYTEIEGKQTGVDIKYLT